MYNKFKENISNTHQNDNSFKNNDVDEKDLRAIIN